MSAVAQPPPLAAPALRLARPLSSSSSDSARSDASPTLSSPSCSPPVQYKHLVGPPLRNYRSPPAADGADTEGESSNSSDLDLDSPQDRDEDRQLDSLRDEVDAESIIGPLISRTQSNALYASAHTPANISESDDDEPPPPLPPRLPGMLDVPPLPSRTGVLKKPPAASGGVRPLLEGPEAKPRVGFAEHKKTGTRRTRLPSFTLPNMSLPHLSLPSFASGGSGLSGGGKLHKKGHDRQRSKTLSLPRPSSIMFSGSAARAVTMFTGRTMEEPATQQEPPSQRMRRASSVSCLAGGNLPLSRSDSMVSVSSSINDDSKYLHIHSQTNSRFKAIKDNFVDALPQLPALQQQFASLNPFTDGSAAAPITPLKGSFRQSAALDAIDTVTGDVVVMGGYRGSILRDKTVNNRRVWIPLKVGFNLRKVDLEVGLEAEDEERMADRIHADGMLTHIGPVDISRRLIRKLRNTAEEHDRKVHDYGYDWRLSPDLLSRRLIAFLEKLPCNQVREGDPTTRRGALVIAHSLGGLIVRHAVNQRPELFSGVLFAGTPMHCVNILGPLRNGDSVLFNSKVFTAQVNFTLRSSFAFLPDDGHCFIDQRTGKPIPLDFFSATVWAEHALSPCVATRPILPAPSKLPLPAPSRLKPSVLGKESQHQNQHQHQHQQPRQAHQHQHSGALAKLDSEVTRDRTLAPQLGSSSQSEQTSTLPLDKALVYLQRTLDNARRFRTNMQFRPDLRDRYPPLAVVYSKTTPTVTGARVDGIDAIRRADVYDDLAFGAGDGVCLARAAMLPQGYHCVKKVAVDRGHVSLLGDLEGVGRCLQAIVAARGW